MKKQELLDYVEALKEELESISGTLFLRKLDIEAILQDIPQQALLREVKQSLRSAIYPIKDAHKRVERAIFTLKGIEELITIDREKGED